MCMLYIYVLMSVISKKYCTRIKNNFLLKKELDYIHLDVPTVTKHCLSSTKQSIPGLKLDSCSLKSLSRFSLFAFIFQKT